MVLIDNINILKGYNPEIWEILQLYEEENNKTSFTLEETRGGNKTLALDKDGSTIYLHSKYNPLREAEVVVESYTEINENTNIIFYGTGLGYHIKLILERYPNVRYYIYEPIPELMHYFLSMVNLKILKPQRLIGMSIGLGEDQRMQKCIESSTERFVVIEMPSHKQNFPQEYKGFKGMILNTAKTSRREIATNYAYQKRWVINSMKNFQAVLSTPNIMMEKQDAFKGKPAILVAAGPSLNEEIENLRYIKENGLAYIFSVGSAISTLLDNNLYPDAVCTYDPTEVAGKNEEGKDLTVFAKVREKGIKEIPMIFGSSVGYRTHFEYPGDKYHMITGQDTASKYYLKSNKKDGKIKIVQDAPSIAVVTVEMLEHLGFETIILVGQNLGYKGKEGYSEGISYGKKVTDEEMKKGIWVKDVENKEILTNESFNTMRNQLEYYIKGFPNIKVVNTTQGGAHIEGTKFVPLKEVIENDLKEKVVEWNWLEGNEQNYNKEYLAEQLNKMEKAYTTALKIVKDYYAILDKIDKLINNRNFKQTEKMYGKVDQELRRMENNDYYITFILPMNRVQYKILTDSIDSLNAEKDPYQKGKRIVKSFRQFMDDCNEDIEMTRAIYDEMKEAIVDYTTPSL